MPLPLIKLASLFVKQLSKPLANAVKSRAKANPVFRKICMKPAEWYHYYEINIKMKLLGLGKAKTKQPLNPEAAVELGAELIGEVTLYTFLVGIIFAEYSYSSRSSEKDKEDSKQHCISQERRINELDLNVATQEAEIRELQRTVGTLHSKIYSLMENKLDKNKKS